MAGFLRNGKLKPLPMRSDALENLDDQHTLPAAAALGTINEEDGNSVVKFEHRRSESTGQQQQSWISPDLPMSPYTSQVKNGIREVEQLQADMENFEKV